MTIRRMILIIIILIVIFGLFLNYSFNKIQTVDMNVEVIQIDNLSPILQNNVNRLYKLSDVPFINNLTMFDYDIEIMFVDHQNKQAVLVGKNKYNSIEHQALDKSIINCNSYTVYINKQPTIVVNCDEILEDPVAQAIMLSYQFGAQGFETLNPNEVEYFQNPNMDKMDSYLRFMMIDSLMDVYFNDTTLETFNFYYDSWIEHSKEDRYQDIVNYDYYDGIREYIILKVKMQENITFNLKDYINSLKNKHNIYTKDNEYKILGLLWCLIAEREGIDLLYRDSSRTDRYRLLLQGIPYTDIDDKKSFEEYEEYFNKMMSDLSLFIKNVDNENQDINPVEMNLVSENYGDTVKIDESHYIYLNYTSRDINGNLLEKDYMLVELSPYKILYYIDVE